MHGAATMTKNIRRVGIRASKNGRSNPSYVAAVAIGPTSERISKAEGHFTVGDDQQGGKIHTMRDDPLGRMFARASITGAEYAALQKYHHHWYHAGLEMGMGSMDLNRVFASDPGSMSGMAKTEGQAHHRQQWRAARAALGHRVGVVVDNVVCAGHTLETAGFSIGWRSKPQAIAAATEMMREAGYRLAALWGIG